MNLRITRIDQVNEVEGSYQEVGRRLEGAQLWKKVEHPLLTTLKHFFDHTFVIRI